MPAQAMPDLVPVELYSTGGVLVLLGLAILYATVGRWIYADARNRGSEWAWQWGFGTPLTVFLGVDVFLLVIVIYLLLRASDDRAAASNAERAEP
ncbi:hypothetical protein SAMN05216564_11139 [Halopenitus persicus]|uniref:Uncharacterized protein n=2 Tax=Halopenitus persicus TaxID=1048396 RepID=A0A1H3N2W7_9EURY|nr:hypothetical protein SAMN05216564_11139 [Halopenitus persicus]